MRLGTCCKSRCEQSTVWPVHVHTRGHFWSMLLVPPMMPFAPPIDVVAVADDAAVFAKFVPCTKMPTLPTLLNVPNDESPFPYGINCNSKITKLVVVAFTTQLSGGFFIFAIISHIWLLASIVIWVGVGCSCGGLLSKRNALKLGCFATFGRSFSFSLSLFLYLSVSHCIQTRCSGQQIFRCCFVRRQSSFNGFRWSLCFIRMQLFPSKL